jgi:hypothetical protein
MTNDQEAKPRDTQNTAPERIWLDVKSESEAWTGNENLSFPNDVCYIRTDLHERLMAEAVASAVQTVLDDVGYTYEQLGEDARALIAEYGGKSDV